jgi:hypothetical protein
LIRKKDLLGATLRLSIGKSDVYINGLVGEGSFPSLLNSTTTNTNKDRK